MAAWYPVLAITQTRGATFFILLSCVQDTAPWVTYSSGKRSSNEDEGSSLFTTSSKYLAQTPCSEQTSASRESRETNQHRAQDPDNAIINLVCWRGMSLKTCWSKTTVDVR